MRARSLCIHVRLSVIVTDVQYFNVCSLQTPSPSARIYAVSVREQHRIHRSAQTRVNQRGESTSQRRV